MLIFCKKDISLVFESWKELSIFQEKIINKTTIKPITTFKDSSPCLKFKTLNDIAKIKEFYPEDFI